jgi:voltage-gated potassium channel Kch
LSPLRAADGADALLLRRDPPSIFVRTTTEAYARLRGLDTPTAYSPGTNVASDLVHTESPGAVAGIRGPARLSDRRAYEIAQRIGDPVLMFMALATIPLLIAQTAPLSRSDDRLLTVANWIVYAPFVVVAFVRLAAARDRTREVGLLKWDLAVVIAQPVLAIIEVGGGVIGAPLVRLLVVAFRFLLRGAAMKRTWRNVRSHPIGMLFGAVPLLWLLCSALALRAETATSYGTIRSVGDALWWGVVTIATVGYGDISPKTPLGRVAGAATMIVGVGAFSLLTAKLAEYLLSQKDAEGRAEVDTHDHFLILGWSPTVRTVVGELAVAEPGAEVVILGSHDRKQIERDLAASVAAVRDRRIRVTVRTGESTSSADRARVHPEHARAVIVLDDSDGDAAVVTSVLGMLGDGLPAKVAIVAELDDPDNTIALGAVFAARVHAVDAVSLGARVAAQACRQPGLGRAHLDLFDFAGTGVYVLAVPQATDVRFGVVQRAVDGARILGVCRPDGSVELVPPPSQCVRAGERLVVLAHDPKDVRWCAERAVVPPTVVEITEKPPPAPDHTVVLGWNLLGPHLLAELDRMAVAGSKVSVAAPGASLVDLRVRLRTAELAVHDIEGADHSAVLRDLLAAGCDHVVVLSPRSGGDPAEADARALLTTLLVHQALGDRDIPVITELANLSNLELLPEHPSLDAVVAEHLTGLLCAQFAVSPSINPVLGALLAADGPRLEALPVAFYCTPGVPVRFGDLADAAAARGEVALGWRRVRPRTRADELAGVVLNPAWDVAVVVTAEDRLIVLAPPAEPGTPIAELQPSGSIAPRPMIPT